MAMPLGRNACVRRCTGNRGRGFISCGLRSRVSLIEPPLSFRSRYRVPISQGLQVMCAQARSSLLVPSSTGGKTSFPYHLQ